MLFMSALSQYFAEIGRRGGIKSRRALDPETARRMVRIREARRAARRAHASGPQRLGGIATDTSAAIQRIQDALWLRLSPAEKLAQVASLSRMVDQLSLAGLRLRNPAADDQTIRFLRAELRLGRDLAVRVYGGPKGA